MVVLSSQSPTSWCRAGLVSLLAAALFACAPARAQPVEECLAEDRIIACFRAFETGLRPFHDNQLTQLANQIAWRYVESGDDRHVIVATGHAATWRDTPQLEYLRNSYGRAIVVAEALTRILDDDYNLGPDRVLILVASASNGQPRPELGYASQSARALQRRVEISAPRPEQFDEPPPETLDTALEEAADGTCRAMMLEHITNPDLSPVFVSFNALSEYLDETLHPEDFDPLGHRVADIDMRALVTSLWTSNLDMPYERRVGVLRAALRRSCRDIRDMIRLVHIVPCDDPRGIAFRTDFFARRDDPTTVYGREPFRIQLSDKMDEMSGLLGEMRPELACTA